MGDGDSEDCDDDESSWYSIDENLADLMVASGLKQKKVQMYTDRARIRRI